VVGAPGSGKTTLLHYTAVRLCEVLARDDYMQFHGLGLADTTQQEATPPVPLLPLREFGSYLSEAGAREAAGANPQLLLECLANHYGRAALDLPPDFLTGCVIPAPLFCCSTDWKRWSRVTTECLSAQLCAALSSAILPAAMS
jgi:hypothetical protein